MENIHVFLTTTKHATWPGLQNEYIYDKIGQEEEAQQILSEYFFLNLSKWGIYFKMLKNTAFFLSKALDKVSCS